MSAWSRRLAFAGLGVGVLLLDQASKALSSAGLAGGPVELLDGILRLELVENSGLIFGLFPSISLAVVLAAVLVCLLLLFQAGQSLRSSPWVAAALALQFGGTAGNLLDRVRLGHVVDFIALPLWPVFNLADLAITCGAIMLAVQLLRASGKNVSNPV